MSNNPKKAQDATEAAMAAIQEALNVRDAEMKAASSSPPRPQPPPPAPEGPQAEPRLPLPSASVEPRKPAAGQTEGRYLHFRKSHLMSSPAGRPMTTGSRSARSCRTTRAPSSRSAVHRRRRRCRRCGSFSP